MSEDTIKKRYAIKLLANIILGAINILLVAIVPKALGPVAYGQFNYLQQFYTQIISFIDNNSSTAFFTKLSANNNRHELIVFYAIASAFIAVIVASFTIFSDLLGGGELFFPDISKKNIYLGFVFCFFVWLSQVYIKISDAYALTVTVELWKIAHRVFMLMTLFIVINLYSLDLTSYLYFNVFSVFILLVILNFILSRKRILQSGLFFRNINYKVIFKEFYIYCSPLFFFNVTAISVGIFDIWLLQRVSGSIEVGFYGLAYSIAAMCFLFTSAMVPIIMREFSQSIEKKDIESAKKLFSRYVPRLYAISAYFSVFVAFHAAELLLIFTDERFEGAYMVLVIMAFYPLHQTYGQINAALLFSAEKITIYKNIGLLSTFLGLVLSVVCIYLFNMGAEGLAWKMVLIQFLSVNVQLFYNAKYLKDEIINYLCHQFFCVILLVLVAYITCFSLFDSLILDFIISGVLYTSIIVIIFLSFPHLLLGKKVYEN